MIATTPATPIPTANPSDPPALTIMQPGEGATGWLGSIGVQFKLSGTQTSGAVSIVEHPFPVGALVVPHLHTQEDEYSIVTEGEIGFRSGDREVVLGPGGYITKPRGEMHTMWNAGQVPARMIRQLAGLSCACCLVPSSAAFARRPASLLSRPATRSGPPGPRSAGWRPARSA